MKSEEAAGPGQVPSLGFSLTVGRDGSEPEFVLLNHNQIQME